MSDTADYYTIYEGVWTNWSRGKVLGSTITLNRRDGGLLISFITLFITQVGTAFWRILCFTLHQNLSAEAPRDALYHQRQAILRNSANGASGLWSLVEVLWTWRRYEKHRPYYRILPTIILTVFFIGSFAVAGIFSSKIATSTGTEVLVSSEHCGYMDEVHSTATQYLTILAPYGRKRATDSDNYAQNCYTNMSSPEGCRMYVKKQLPWTSNRNASCPFPKEICKNEYNNLELDTGFIDSNDHLGINAPPDQRMGYRTVFRCAPLAVDNYTTNVSVRRDELEATLTRFHMGPTLFGDLADDFTFERWDYVNKTSNSIGTNFRDYSLTTRVAYMNNDSVFAAVSNFEPIPQLLSPHADIKLVFLSGNDIVFSEETIDPWYSARQRVPSHYSRSGNTSSESVDVYSVDAAASVLGCTQQFQLCNPNLPLEEQCTPPATFADIFYNESTWSPEGGNFKALERLVIKLLNFDPTSFVASIGITSLTSRYRLAAGIQGPLPDNQWQLDVEHWFKGSLAQLQQDTVEYATGPPDPAIREFIRSYDNLYNCKNQKILTTAYTNFNTFGLCLTLALGGLIILTSYILEPLVSYIQKNKPSWDKYSRLEWCANETLQLQRLAHEELGLGGTWRRCADAVPLTDAGERLGMLDLADLEHPRLKAPPAGLEDVMMMMAAAEQSEEEKKASGAGGSEEEGIVTRYRQEDGGGGSSSSSSVAENVPAHACSDVDNAIPSMRASSSFHSASMEGGREDEPGNPRNHV